MEKWYSILFSHLCHWPDYSMRECSKFCILRLCPILFFIVSYAAGAQHNSDIIHQNALKKAFVLRSLVSSHHADYDGNIITFQKARDKSVTSDSIKLEKLVPYGSIALIIIVLTIVMKFLLLPKVHFEEDQSVIHPNVFQQIENILMQPQSVWGLIILISYFYFSSEVLAGNSIDDFAKRLEVYVSDMDFYQKLILFTLTAMVIGCILGMALIPKYVSLLTFLKLTCLLGVLFAVAILFISPCTTVALPGIHELPVVIILVALMGFVNALFWPVIWSIVFQDFKDSY